MSMANRGKKLIFTEEWQAQLNKFSPQLDELNQEIEHDKNKLLRKFFNGCVEDYKTDLGKAFPIDKKLDLAGHIRNAKKNKRAYKIDMVHKVMQQLDLKVLDKSALEKLIMYVQSTITFNLHLDADGGRFGARLNTLLGELQLLLPPPTPSAQRLSVTGGRRVTTLDLKLDAKDNDDSGYTHLEGLHYAVMYKQLEKVSQPKSGELSVMDKICKKTPLYLEAKLTDLEKEIVACEKLALASKYSAFLQELPVQNDAKLQEKLAQAFFIRHSLAQIKQKTREYFVDQLHKYASKEEAWYEKQVFDLDEHHSIFRHAQGFKKLEDRLEAILEKFELDKKNAEDQADEKDDANIDLNIQVQQAKKEFADTLKAFFNWPASISMVTDKKQAAGEKEKSLPDDEKHYHLALQEIYKNINSGVVAFKNNMRIHKSYSVKPEAELKEIIVKGDLASEELLKTDRFTQREHELNVSKNNGLIAVMVFEIKQLIHNFLQKISSKKPIIVKDVKDHKAAAVGSVGLFSQVKLFKKSQPLVLDVKVQTLNENIQQTIDFYLAKHKGKGAHIAVIKHFKEIVGSGSSQPLVNELIKFWNSESVRYGSEDNLAAMVNVSRGHHFQRMVGLLLQDMKLLTPHINLYQGGYHGDYCLSLSHPVKFKVQAASNKAALLELQDFDKLNKGGAGPK